MRELERRLEKIRGEADLYERRGLEREARLLRSVVADLEAALEEWREETLTLDQAAGESELSKSTLQKKVASGEIPNAGRKGSPMIARQDIPKRKPMREAPQLETGDPDFAEEVLHEDRLRA